MRVAAAKAARFALMFPDVLVIDEIAGSWGYAVAVAAAVAFVVVQLDDDCW